MYESKLSLSLRINLNQIRTTLRDFMRARLLHTQIFTIIRLQFKIERNRPGGKLGFLFSILVYEKLNRERFLFDIYNVSNLTGSTNATLILLIRKLLLFCFSTIYEMQMKVQVLIKVINEEPRCSD